MVKVVALDASIGIVDAHCPLCTLLKCKLRIDGVGLPSLVNLIRGFQ